MSNSSRESPATRLAIVKPAILYLLLFVPSLLLLSGCIWRQDFELGWDEEVRLLDGQVIVVHVTQTYERRASTWRRYGNSIPRDSELRFDAGEGTGTVVQMFKGFRPMFLDRFEGTWYGVLYGGYYKRSREIPGQDWGTGDSPAGQLAIKLVDGKWRPIPMRDLPAVFKVPNMLVLKGGATEHASFDSTLVTLLQKEEWKKQHPPGYSDYGLIRPRSTGQPSASTGPAIVGAVPMDLAPTDTGSAPAR